MDSRCPVQAGDVVAGKYLIQDVLGSGGMGIVLRARHLLLDERVALKLPLPELVHSPRSIARFLREARAASRLRSAHVVRIRDVDTLPSGAPMIVMDLLEGRDLAAICRSEGPQAVDDAVSWVLEACEALAEAHAVGIVHRDIKPSNMFLAAGAGKAARLVLLDFGVARIVDGRAGDLTGSNQILGSPQYMSPEQVRHAESVGPETDVWSLGVVLYELLSGHLPFSASSSTGVLASIVADRAPPLRELAPDLPEGLAQAVERCLAKDAERRHPSVVALAEALAPFSRRGTELLQAVREAAERVPPPSDRTADPILVVPEIDQTASNWGQHSRDERAPASPRRSRRAAWLGAITVITFGALLLLSGATSSGSGRRTERALSSMASGALRAARPVPSPARVAPVAPLASAAAPRAPRPAAALSAAPATAASVPTDAPVRGPPAARAASNASSRSAFEIDHTVDTRR